MDPRPYCRFPALRGDALVFVAAGDLWRLQLGETVPRRLTSVQGAVARPQVSPDGRWVAFSARHDGAAAVHLMPAEGGESRRLVFHPSACEPVSFSPDGQRVLFVSSLASTSARSLQLFSVSLEGGDVRREGYGPAGAIAFSKDGRLACLARGYQDPATWKRYSGGLAGTLWLGTVDPLDLRRLTLGPRGESQPGFWGDRLVHLSDEDGCGNVWSCDLEGEDRRQHTRHETYYARWPSVDDGRVAYQHAGDLRLLELASGRDDLIEIDLAADVGSVRRRYVDASRFLEAARPSPDGSKVLVTARGKVVSLPAWRGPARPVGDADGVRFQHAAWMPDGKSVALCHDEGGEEILEIRPVDGQEPPRSFGRPGDGRLRCLVPSPDGKWLAVSEQSSGLHLIDVESGARRPVDRPATGAIMEVAWSSDSRWLAYARPLRYRQSLFLHDVEQAVTHRLTSEEFDDGDPCFDPAGRYLYFLSRRVYNPYADELQHDVAFPATTKPYAIVLAADRPSPFAPLPAQELGLDSRGEARQPSERVEEATATAAEGPEGEREKDKEKEKDKAPERVRIDLEGLSRRVVEIPVREGRYAALLATKEKVFLLRRPLLGMFGAPGEDEDDAAEAHDSKLVAFELVSREEKLQAAGVKSASLSSDGKWLLLRGEGTLRLIAAGSAPQATSVTGGRPGEKTGLVDLSRLRTRVEPREEWRQIFREAWRQQRGHFWTESMSSVDWDAMYVRYEPLLRRVRTRDELSDLLWDLQGELGTSHAYVIGGDEPPRPNYRIGLLGCDFELDAASDRYRIARIHAGDTWAAGAHSPLVVPGAGVKEGDWLLAVDGREARGRFHPWLLLERPGPAVTLRIASSADGSGARDVVVAPLVTEYRCRYREWVTANQELVALRSEDRLGYVHVPDMQVQGLVEFHRGFLWQSDRDGLIVDVRDNAGGNVSQILLGKLRREILGYCKARWAEPLPLPEFAPHGPMVALCNEMTGSDGDIFCQSWKQLHLGPLIGKRTWGGVIGIDRSKTLIDGGQITQPEYAFWFRDRGWDVEGHGVDPDIEVDISPADHAAGRDPQLERAVTEALRLLTERGDTRLDLPPPPDRSRR